MKPLALALTAALLLGACAQPRPPQAETPALPDRYVAGDAGTASPVLESAWWTRYREPGLDALIDQALARNLDLRLAAARIDEAAVAVSLARAAQWPSVDLQGSIVHSRASTLAGQPVTNATTTLHRVALATTFEIDLWGKLRDADRAAQAQLLSTQHARDTVRLALVGTLAQAWLGLRALDVQRATVDRQLQWRRDSQQLVDKRVQGGVASGLESVQAQAALAALSAQAIELDRQRALLEHQIGQLAGQPGLVIAPDARPLPDVAVVPAGLPSELLQRRPDVAQAEAAMRASFAQFDVTKKSAWPTLALTGSLGSQSNDLVNLLKAGARIWSIGPSILVSIFDAGRNEARSAEARARAEQAAIGWQKSALTAFREVADALDSGRLLAAQEEQVERQRAAAIEAQRIATRRYEAGYAGYLEVLDAQRTASDAELAWVRVRQARLEASVALLKALGGGWQPAG